MRTRWVANVALLSSNFIAISDDVIYYTAKTDDHLSCKWLQFASIERIFHNTKKQAKIFSASHARERQYRSQHYYLFLMSFKNEMSCWEDQKFNWNLRTREYWKIYLSQPSCVSSVELTDGRRGGGAKSYGEKARFSINQSILSGEDHLRIFTPSA